MARDYFSCIRCGSTTETLHVHHIYYTKTDPWDYPDTALVTLCCSCHLYIEGANSEYYEHYKNKLLAYTQCVQKAKEKDQEYESDYAFEEVIRIRKNFEADDQKAANETQSDDPDADFLIVPGYNAKWLTNKTNT